MFRWLEDNAAGEVGKTLAAIGATSALPPQPTSSSAADDGGAAAPPGAAPPPPESPEDAQLMRDAGLKNVRVVPAAEVPPGSDEDGADGAPDLPWGALVVGERVGAAPPPPSTRRPRR